MADLFARQGELSHRMGRIVENLKKRGSANITPAVIRVRMGFLEKMWSEFWQTHQQIVMSVEKDATLRDRDYFSEGQFDAAEEIFLEQQGQLQELLDKHETPAAASLNDTSAILTASRSESRPRAALPRIDLPKFSGEVDDWPSFRDLFTSLVIHDESLSDVERFHYLRTSVTGSAQLRLRNLPVTEQNFKRAWDLMRERYENPRLLIHAQLRTLFSLPVANRDSADDLRRIIDTACDIVASFDSMGRSLTSPGDMLVYLLVTKLDSFSRREWESQLGSSSDPVSFERVKSFIDARINTLSSMREFASASKAAPERSRSGAKVLQTAVRKPAKTETCPLCSSKHMLMTCTQYRDMEPAARYALVSKRQFCVNCLGRHSLDLCRSERTCQRCSQRHHTSLHDAAHPPQLGPTVHAASSSGQPASVMLATARLRLHDDNGGFQWRRALVDPGSQVSLVSEDVVQSARLSRQVSRLPLFGVAGVRSATARGVTHFEVSPHFNVQERVKVTAFILPSLTNYRPSHKSLQDLPAPFRNLRHADPEMQGRHSIDIVLGADVYPALLRDGLLVNPDQTLAAQNSVLGWLLTGCTETTHETPTAASSLQVCTPSPLHNWMECFWRLEEVEQPRLSSPDDQICEEHFRTTHSRTQDGRYVVRLPLKPNSSLGESRQIAAERLRSLERRFRRNPGFREVYSAFMTEYEKLGHMVRCESSSDGHRYYLPHHGVIKASSTTTKLRVVFNASQATSNGLSLNDVLYSGPNLLADLTDVLVRWRTHRVALATDIVKMYRQILVHPADRPLQCILWQASEDSEPREYELSTVTYGTACAPFLAIRTLHQLAKDHASEFPRASEILIRDAYVDDILTGASSPEEARNIVRELSRLCTAGGFPLQKWRSNVREVFADTHNDRLSFEPHDLEDSAPILGVQWCAEADVFKVQMREDMMRKATTKRAVLSQIARLFDPIGWLTPVIVWAKCFMQDLWLEGCAWDAPLSEKKLMQWQLFQGELPALHDLSLPRWLQNASGMMEIHGFADASERAYAAVVYVRTCVPEGEPRVAFLGAKTKVAPLKRVSLPRLELNAALLLSKLVRRLVTTLGWQDVPIHCWTDSTITLHWVTSHASRWKTYVANRTAEIQTAIPAARWHHIPGNCNPADIASRGVTPGSLLSAQLWWQGPPLLLNRVIEYPALALDDTTEERRVIIHVVKAADVEEENSVLTRFSNLERLLRISCWCLRWRKSKPGGVLDTGITASERNAVLLRWVRSVQERHFPEELRRLKKKETVPVHSRLVSLSPFLDADGVIRVGGRLANSFLSQGSKTPFILPADSHFTDLYIQAAHLRTLHGGTQLTLAQVRQQAWPLRGRQLVKRVIRTCLPCIRWRANPMTQQMSQLPADRVQPSRPFSCVGVDYAGRRFVPGCFQPVHRSTWTLL